MSNVIKIKRGTGAPSNIEIADGEVAVDTSAQSLYINDSGTVKQVGLPTTGGTMTGSIDMAVNSITDVRNLDFDAGGTVNSVLDEDDMASDAAGVLATQQSIKAYVDNNFTSVMVHTYYTSLDSGLYIPFGGSTRAGTDAGSYSYGDDSIFVAPFDGTLKKLVLRNDYSGTATPGAVACYLNTNDSDGSVMNLSFNSWIFNSPFEYVCQTSNTFSEGDLLAIKVDPTVAPRYVTITSVWEFRK